MIYHYLVNSFGYSMTPYVLDRNFQGHWYIPIELIRGRVIKGQFSQGFGLEHIIV